MANTLQPVDVYTLVNAAAKEMYGADSTLQARDTSSFVSVGEHMLRTGYTNTLNALSVVFGRTIEAVRPYRGEVELIAKTRDEFGGIERKISFYSKVFEATKNFNTDINPTQLVDGQSIDHYVISKVYPLEINFCGMKTLEFSYTTFRKQLRVAFQSEAEFSAFYSAMMISVANDIAMGYEAENKLQVLNAIGATYNVGGARQKVNLTEAYNEDGSDVHICSGVPPILRKDGILFEIKARPANALSPFAVLQTEPFTTEELKLFVEAYLAPSLREEGFTTGSIDASYSVSIKQTEFFTRVNAFYDSRGISIAFRLLKKYIPAMTKLRIPMSVQKLRYLDHGLVVLTGATGHVGYAVLMELLSQGRDTTILLRKKNRLFDGLDCGVAYASKDSAMSCDRTLMSSSLARCVTPRPSRQRLPPLRQAISCSRRSIPARSSKPLTASCSISLATARKKSATSSRTASRASSHRSSSARQEVAASRLLKSSSERTRRGTSSARRTDSS